MAELVYEHERAATILGRALIGARDRGHDESTQMCQLWTSIKGTKRLNADLNKRADDCHDYFDKIRDKLAAHRQDLPIEEAWDVWNQIDAAPVGILADDAIATWQKLTAIDASAPGGEEDSSVPRTIVEIPRGRLAAR